MIKKLLGNTPINPMLFLSAKITMFFTWLSMIVYMGGIPVLWRFENPVKDMIAISLFTIGFIIAIISLINLGNSTSMGLPEEDTAFKSSGLYKFSRNPMYLGFALISIGSMIYFMNPFILAMGVYSIIIHDVIIKAEENFLRKRFGETYEKYCLKVRRYI
ncbi:MAG: isoprenylcysteine carboxylmethyltransferase family protein [Bacteroidia bacterium]|nr:isoprenylcysteine carboxylmethyltransferase family protein [Bacteroidia bacterium]